MGVDSYNLEALRRAIRPFRLYWFSRLRSTSDHAMRLRRAKKLFAPSVVLTGCQTAGRGRGSNVWWSGAGSITMTVCLPVDDGFAAHHVPLLAGLAVRRALTGVTGGADIQLKWPNDLLHDDLKLAGLLCERVDRVDLVGIGLNVNLKPNDLPAGLGHRVTSLGGIAGMSLDRTPVLVSIIRQIESLLVRRDQGTFATLLREYDRSHALRHRRIRVLEAGTDAPIEGVCEGLDREGRLLIRSVGRVRQIVAGRVDLIV